MVGFLFTSNSWSKIENSYLTFLLLGNCLWPCPHLIKTKQIVDLTKQIVAWLKPRTIFLIWFNSILILILSELDLLDEKIKSGNGEINIFNITVPVQLKLLYKSDFTKISQGIKFQWLMFLLIKSYD